MARIESYEAIMAPTAQHVDDYTMGMQFPACDFAGWFLFAACKGDGPVQAINLGVHVGRPDLTEAGLPWRADIRRIFVIASSIVEGVSYRWLDETSWTRDDVIYRRDKCDVQVGDVVRVRGSWPDFEMYFLDPVHGIEYDLRGRAKHVYWVPDHLHANLFYAYVLLPDFEFTGTVTVKGKSYAVEGLGGFDHLNGRFQPSESSPSIGYWQYDPIHWSNGCVANGLYFIGASGDPVVGGGFTSLPDDGYHPATLFEVEFLELTDGTANAGSSGPAQKVPRRWRARMTTSAGTLSYVATARAVVDPSGMPILEPNVVFDAVGEYRHADGRAIALMGKGHNEYMGGALDPSQVKQPDLG